MQTIKKLSFIILFAIILSAFAFNFAINAAEEEVKANPSGAYLKYTVNVNRKDGDNLAFNFTILKKLDYVIQEGDMLEYDVMSLVNEGGWGNIDGDIEKVGVLRDSGVLDTLGNSNHTGTDVSEYCYDQWWHRAIILGVTEEENGEKFTVGRKFKNIQLAMHPNNSAEDIYTGVVLYDNIVITNNGEIKLVIFRDEADFDPAEVKFSHNKNNEGKGSIEMFVFTAEEMQAMKDKEEAKIREAEEKEKAKAEAEASKEASREQASIDASVAASIAEEEAANRTEPITEPADSNASAEGESNILVILICAIGIPVIFVIVIVVVVVSKKKKK